MLIPTQACYDVQAYSLGLLVDPATKTIHGTLTMQAAIVAATGSVTLDLDGNLTVARVEVDGEQVEVVHADGRIEVPCKRAPGAEITVAVTYGGTPRVAPNPPWGGGFTWAKTSTGEPWIATTCQGEGADLWWTGARRHRRRGATRVDAGGEGPHRAAD